MGSEVVQFCLFELSRTDAAGFVILRVVNP